MNNEISQATGEEPDKDARTWAMVCHLTALSGFVVPFGNLLGPLIVWAIKRDEHPFIDDQGKEAINFQLTLTIAFAISFILIFIFIGFPLIVILLIYNIIMIVIAAIKANEGGRYRYPCTIHFFK